MAQPQDIRRQTGDVSPNNFIQPGVQDNSIAEAVKGLGEIGMAVDAKVAETKFGEAIETLRSQYITGKTPQEVASVVDEPEVDEAADYVPTAEDNKALASFGKVLDAHAQAVAQGVRSDDMFRVSAERLYRIAISKRPGLAREFRGVAERFLGFDVVGTSVALEAKQDAEFIKSLADKAKTKDEQAADLIKRQREQWEKIYPQSAFVPDSQWASYTASKMDEFLAVTSAATAAQVAKTEVEMYDLQGKKSAEADERFYITQVDALRKSYGSGIDRAMLAAQQPDERGQRLIDSPAGMRQVIAGLQGQLESEVAKLDAAIAGRQVPNDTKSRYRALIDKDLGRIQSVLSMQDDTKFMETANSFLRAAAARSVLKDDELLVISAMDNELSDVVMDKWVERYGKTAAIAGARVITGAMPVNTVAKTGREVLSQLLGSVWPQGSTTPADPVAASKAAENISKVLSSYYLQDDGNFNPATFTEWEGRKGVLPMLTDRARIIRPSLSDEDSGQITAQIAAASGFSALRLASLLQKKSPALWAKLDAASIWRADTPGLAKPKAGVKLTPAEQQVLTHFGKQFNREIITKAVQAYGGGSPAESWQYIAAQVKPMSNARQEAQAEAEAQAASQIVSEAAQSPSGGGAATPVQGRPQIGAVVRGWRYKGGDPGSRSSWEKAE